jgi:8-oxo-dGTP diphosphatase
VGIILPKTIYFAGALLYYKGEALLMKRGPHKKYSPGKWAGIGGHVEQTETGSPGTACLREIEEETGITAGQIISLDLRYFALLKGSGELHSVYYFTGELKEKPLLTETDEGELHWIKINDGKSLPMAEHTKRIYLHWADNIDSSELKCFLDSGISVI